MNAYHFQCAVLYLLIGLLVQALSFSFAELSIPLDAASVLCLFWALGKFSKMKEQP